MTRFSLNRFLFILLFLSVSVAAVAFNITGVVKDVNSKEPLMEAAVKLVSAKDSAFVAGVTTDIDGKFSIPDIKSGKYILEVGYIGYSDLEKPVTVSNSNLNVGLLSLKESTELLGEVDVVAVKTPIK
ncbi:MAG: carboxypeptidase-like regulatory domain-containing protein, partial [Duncaniella sp.]|nr:carboxypeptidase-like regulatory domain-containing protein [Duncaniella sp.]